MTQPPPDASTSAGFAPITRPLVLIPTYNERDNIERAVTGVRAAVPQADVLVLDDASPDGTGRLADALAEADPHVFVRHRAGKQGLGMAYLDGFAWAKEHGYDAVIEMDADGSHRVADLPAVLAAIDHGDVAIGSRWVPGGSVVNWPAHRKFLSVGANTYTRVLLGMPVRDATAGFRVYRLTALETMGLHGVESHGYCFQIDLTWRAIKAGLTVVEVPITFVEREVGTSKMNSNIIAEALRNVTVWGLTYRARQAAGVIGGLKR
ncbi:MAG: polyprenol monophosphomannose synthase [Dermatophilus congolensis]|nr:polyprenol monophosphomannose synthase [Dermatophilus congolensis]